MGDWTSQNQTKRAGRNHLVYCIELNELMSCIELKRAQLIWFDLIWAELSRIELNWYELSWIEQDFTTLCPFSSRFDLPNLALDMIVWNKTETDENTSCPMGNWTSQNWTKRDGRNHFTDNKKHQATCKTAAELAVKKGLKINDWLKLKSLELFCDLNHDIKYNMCINLTWDGVFDERGWVVLD